MKHNKSILIAFLIVALMVSIIPVVSAEDYLITNYTLPYNTVSVNIPGKYLAVNNMSLFASAIKKVYVDSSGMYAYAGTNGTKTWSVELWYAGSGASSATDYYQIGTGTVTQHIDTPESYFSPATLEIDINEFYGVNNTGFSWVHLKNTSIATYAVSYSYNRGTYNTPSGPSDFGCSFASDVYAVWGNYHLYGNLVYGNFTINVKSNTTGLNIPRADVTYYTTSSSLSGQTDLDGNVYFNLVGSWPQPVNLTVSKAGYNTTVITPFPGTFSGDETINVQLYDVLSTTGTAEVYVDIVDDYTHGSITGATVGIQNTTAVIDQWRYETTTASTIRFNSTGIGPYIPLSVGQTVVFAGYKSGEYSANNTGNYVIPSTISHTFLLLSRVANATGTYSYPVTITDAITGNAIADSWLRVAEQGTTAWHNTSSTTGKFTVAGKGIYGLTPLESGDVLIFIANATGYINGGYAIMVTDSSNGVTQYIPLVKSQYAPLDTEFTMIANAYDADTSIALSGVSIAIQGGLTKSTTTSGSAVFYNLTPDVTYTLTAAKTGYTSQTKTFSGTNGSVVGIDIAMSASSVNPTATSTVSPGATQTFTASQSASSALEFWTNGLNLISVFAYYILIFTLIWMFIYAASGNIPGIKMRGGFLGKLPGVFGGSKRRKP